MRVMIKTNYRVGSNAASAHEGRAVLTTLARVDCQYGIDTTHTNDIMLDHTGTHTVVYECGQPTMRLYGDTDIDAQCALGELMTNSLLALCNKVSA